MTSRHAYMRQWQAKRRWPIQVQTALARLEDLLAARPEGQALPEMPASVRAAWEIQEAKALTMEAWMQLKSLQEDP